MRDFDHSLDQTNASARCMAFTKTVAKGKGKGASRAGPGTGQCLQGFQEKWMLDERCMEFLLSLPAAVQQVVARQFDHQPGQTNASARCMSFAKAVMQKQGSMSPLMQFQARWGLDDQVMEYLGQLPQSVQEIVVRDFDHKPDQTNPSARCRSFARAIMQKAEAAGGGGAAGMYQMVAVYPGTSVQKMGKGKGSAPGQYQRHPSMSTQELGIVLPQLQQMWGLDEKCMQYLQTLPASVLTTVASEFEHKPGQTNPSARCMSFAKSVAQKQGQAQASLGPLGGFQARFGLDERCSEYLASLPEQVQATVIADFTHRPDQTNVSKRCMSFAKSIMAKGGGGAMGNSDGLQASGASQSALFASNETLYGLQATFGLDDRCVEYLATLPSYVLEKVVAEFTHRPDQTNASKRCMAFAKGIMTKSGGGGMGMGGGDAMGAGAAAGSLESLYGFQASYGLDDRCTEYLATLPPQVQATVMAEFTHSPDQTNVSARCMSFARGILARGGYSSPNSGGQGQGALESLYGFQIQWGLDDKCIEYLSTLPGQVQTKVIAEFTHRADQSNPSARCMSFAKRLAQGSAGGYGGAGGYDGYSSGADAGWAKKRTHSAAFGNDGSEATLVNFQYKYGLDEQCVSYLGTLPESVLMKVTQEFTHNQGQTNASARCSSFAKQVLASMKRRQGF